MSKKKKKYSPEFEGEKPISFLNWFFTLLLSIIPGANIIFFIITLSCARTSSKRRFATAALVLTIIVLAGLAIMLWFYSDATINWLNKILEDAGDKLSPGKAV